MTTPVVQALDAGRLYEQGPHGVRGVHGLDLEVMPGEVVGLAGRSGSGKSTALRLLAGMERPDRGSITFGGQPAWNASRGRHPHLPRPGFVMPVFQDPANSLDPRWPVYRSVTEPLTVRHKMTRKQRIDRARELVCDVGLDQLDVTVLPSQLSGGQCQRVAIVRALAGNPALLVADEPTAALDVTSAAGIMHLLRRTADAGTAMIIVESRPPDPAGSRRPGDLPRGRTPRPSPPTDGSGPMTDLDDVAARVDALMPDVREQLRALVAIPSISNTPAYSDEVARSAQAVAQLFSDLGMDTIVTTAGGGHPAVIARREGSPGRPRVLLYAHHDVQPIDPVSDWSSPPFEMHERDGRLFGRGTADDKAGVVGHLAAIKAVGDDVDLDVVVLIEGEEESGSYSMPALLKEHGDTLDCDFMVVADNVNWAVGIPSLTTSLRGLLRVDVEVATLSYAAHSGAWGGLVPDAIMTLNRLLDSLYDDQGGLAIDGLGSNRIDAEGDLELPVDRMTSESGKLDGTSWVGAGSVLDRVWRQSSLTIIGMDVPATQGAGAVLLPRARARLSMRVAPGETTENSLRCLRAHLDRHLPWGAELTVEVVDANEPIRLPSDGPGWAAASEALREAWQVEPVTMGAGGTLPMLKLFQDAFPHAELLLTAVGDPDSRVHSSNESLHLGDFRNAIVAEARLLQLLDQLPTARPPKGTA